jgi:hypothetical protein
VLQRTQYSFRAESTSAPRPAISAHLHVFSVEHLTSD